MTSLRRTETAYEPQKPLPTFAPSCCILRACTDVQGRFNFSTIDRFARAGGSARPPGTRVASKGKPYRGVDIEGFEVLVGRSAEENDVLTFEVAERGDFWLHVGGGTAGSHVVVRNPDGLRELPERVVEAAAALAAWHSKARHAARVDVHVCRVADVSKERGAPAGEVRLRRFKKLRVQPAKGG